MVGLSTDGILEGPAKQFASSERVDERRFQFSVGERASRASNETDGLVVEMDPGYTPRRE